MAANPTLVQSANAASNAAGPATITPTLGGGSTLGNLLIISVAVAGSAVGITTPASWTLLGTGAVAASIQVALFAFPNNPGGITSVAITVTATGGSAIASIFEFSGMPLAASNDFFIQSVGTNQIRSVQFSPPPFRGELTFLAAAFDASASLSQFFQGAPGWSANTAGGTTTTGVPNLTLANWWNLSNGTGAENEQVNLSASVRNGLFAARFQTGNNGPQWGGGNGPEGIVGFSGSPNPQGSWSVG